MRIGLTGTCSVGKTTLVKALNGYPEFNGYSFFTERSKHLRDKGIKLNNESTYKGQLIFASERSLELLENNMITDRSIIDVMAYTLSSPIIKWGERIQLLKTFNHLVNDYDVIFYISPQGVKLEDNSVRNVDEDYRSLIDKTIQIIIHDFNINNIVNIPPNLTVNERISFILKTTMELER